MAGDIVNLRQARKAKLRAEKTARAEQNRVTFGRTKAEREASGAEKDLAARKLEALRRERGQDDG